MAEVEVGMYADAVLAAVAGELERAAVARAQQPLQRVRGLADGWARPNSGWVPCGEVAGRLYVALDGRRYVPARDREGDDSSG